MQERRRFTESLQRIKASLDPRNEQKPVQGTRLGEDASDVTISPDYKKFHQQQNKRFLRSAVGKILASKNIDTLLHNLRD